MTFATRLVAGTLLVLILAVAVLLLAAERSLRRDLEGDIERSLEAEAGLIREALSADSARLGRRRSPPRGAERPADHHRDRHRPGARRQRFPPGPLPAIENHATGPEIRAALAGRTGVATRRSATVGRRCCTSRCRAAPARCGSRPA